MQFQHFRSIINDHQHSTKDYKLNELDYLMNLTAKSSTHLYQNTQNLTFINELLDMRLINMLHKDVITIYI